MYPEYLPVPLSAARARTAADRLSIKMTEVKNSEIESDEIESESAKVRNLTGYSPLIRRNTAAGR